MDAASSMAQKFIPDWSLTVNDFACSKKNAMEFLTQAFSSNNAQFAKQSSFEDVVNHTTLGLIASTSTRELDVPARDIREDKLSSMSLIFVSNSSEHTMLDELATGEEEAASAPRYPDPVFIPLIINIVILVLPTIWIGLD
ncbi:hypothetical protein ACH5RR_028718 [Cinchona calisaya]|uniref:Uncharacterized protein n=1 Tax=Cinchona calisaya TaxID=153742 RepID=A0ABD2YSX2_9GENT